MTEREVLDDGDDYADPPRVAGLDRHAPLSPGAPRSGRHRTADTIVAGAWAERMAAVWAERMAAVWAERMARVWAQHRVMTILVLLAALLRGIAMLGFQPAVLTNDSFVYLAYGLHPGPNWMRPTGYSFLLFLLRPFHSFDAVTGFQHLVGLGVGIAAYSFLRSRGLPQWGASLAAAPTLFDPRQIWLEQSILSDLWFQALIVTAVLLVIGRRRPAWWQATLAGFAVGWATIIRGNGFPLVVIVLGWLLTRRVGWRTIGAAALACAIPVLGYTSWFYVRYGQFTLSEGGGLWLWARTMSFANCQVIKPPHNLLPLCPRNQPDAPSSPAPAWSWTALLYERQPGQYLWDSQAWVLSGPHPGLNPQGSQLAMQFATRAILAQPGAYVRVVAEDVLLTFINTDHAFLFTTEPYANSPLPPAWAARLQQYGGSPANSHTVQPWAFLMFAYQNPVYFPGVAYALVMLAGLARIAWYWRGRARMRPALVAWVSAAVVIVLPVALAQYSYRYALSAVPLACIALALTFMPQRSRGHALSGTTGRASPRGHR